MVAGGVASAQEYPITGGELEISDTSFSPGSSLAVSGDGFAPGTEVVITIQSVELARVDADAIGAFSTTVTIPANFPSGEHTVTATGVAASDGIRTLAVTVTVTVAGALPLTGFSLSWWLVGVAVLALGVGVVTVRWSSGKLAHRDR